MNESIPRVRRLAAPSRQQDRWLAATGFYLLGDLHDFNNAPKAAIRAYRKCLKLDPDEAGAWREIAEMHISMGEYRAAKRTGCRAWKLDPELFGVEEPSYFDELIRRNEPAVYRKDDLLWQASELLARFQPNKCLALLASKHSIQARQWRARAHGARGDAASVMEQWAAISETKAVVRTHLADWFHLPEGVWEEPIFWAIMLKIARSNRFAPDADFNLHESLWDVRPPLSRQRKSVLHFQYHIARTRKDRKVIASLSAKYPAWKEAAELISQLESLPAETSLQHQR